MKKLEKIIDWICDTLYLASTIVLIIGSIVLVDSYVRLRSANHALDQFNGKFESADFHSIQEVRKFYHQIWITLLVMCIADPTARQPKSERIRSADSMLERCPESQTYRKQAWSNIRSYWSREFYKHDRKTWSDQTQNFRFTSQVNSKINYNKHHLFTVSIS